MLSPRLTNCKECANIPDLLRKIDCKLAELGNNLYNNVVFMLNRPIAVSQISELLVYKRVLTFRYCDTHYASGCPEVSTEDIASKVIRLTAGCVSLCNEPTVCEITTCAIIPCPNPTTTTTSTSSTSTTTTTSTTATPTTTTTTTITPDCRIEGCFDIIALATTTTTSTSSTSSTTTTSTTVVPFDCAEPFNLSSPEAFPNVITGNGTKVLSNGVLLTTSYTPNTFNQPPIYVAGVPGTTEVCNGAYVTSQSGGQGTLSMRGGSTVVMDFNPPINAIAFVTQGYGSSKDPSATETVVITSTDVIVATELTACGDYATTQISQNEINLTGSQALYPNYSAGVTAISPISGGISQLRITINPPADALAGIGFDFYVCPGSSPITTTTTSTSSTTTSTSSTTTTTTSSSTSTTTSTTTIVPTTTTTTTVAPTTTTTTTIAACVDCIPSDVTIGTQTWSKCNLNVDTYLNGDPIPEVTDPNTWIGLTTGAWCYYSNDSANEPTYGKLYNWFAVNDPRGLAPTGYHIPTNDEVITLLNYIDPTSSGGATLPNNAGGPLKEVQFCHWDAPNTGATNSSGFTGLPGGLRETLFGVFAGINEIGAWWSSTEDIDGADALGFNLYHNQNSAYRGDTKQNHGYSVRLIKDTGTTTTTTLAPTTTTTSTSSTSTTTSTTTVAPTTTTTTTVAPTTTTTTTVAPTTTTTSTTLAPTTTTTSTTLPPLVGCLEFDYLTLVTFSDWYTNPPYPIDVNNPSLYVQVAFNTGPTTNTTSYTDWDQVPNTNYDVVFNIGGVDYTAEYQFIDLGIGSISVPYGKFSTNGGSLSSMSVFQFSKIDANGNDLSSILSTFDYTNGDGVKVTAYGDCTTPTTTTTTTVAPTTTTTTTVAPTTTTTTTLPVFLCTNPLLTVSLPDGIVGDPLNGSVVYDGLNLAITSYTYGGGNTTVYIAGTVAYTLGFIVPSGYSNSGSATGCAVAATGTTPTTTTTTTVAPTTTTTTTSAKSYDIDWEVVGGGNGFKEAELQLFKNGASVVTQVITNSTPSVQGLFSSSNGDVINAKLTTKNLTSEETQVQNSFLLIGAGGLQELDTGILQPPAGGVTNSLATSFSTGYTQPGVTNGPLLLFKVNQEQIASSEITMSLTNNGANLSFEIQDNDQSGNPVVVSIPTTGPIWNGNYYYDFLVGREYTVTFPYSNNEVGGVSTELVITGGGMTPFSYQENNPSGSLNTITHTFTVLNATSIVIEAFEY